MPETRILIDSSYFNFYRFFATTKWYNYSQDRRKAAENVEWTKNKVFMATFEKMWFETIYNICRKFNVRTGDFIFARDGSDIWRYKVYPQYKAHRDDLDGGIHSPKGVFDHVAQHFYARVHGSHVIYADCAEADDIIAVTVRYLTAVQPETRLIIITCDHDLLQLHVPGRVDLFQLKGICPRGPRRGNPNGQLTGNGHVALMTKILAGDPSDNIPPSFKGCGKKTAISLAGDPMKLETVLNKVGREQYELNRLLIDFEFIPDALVSEIEATLDTII